MKSELKKLNSRNESCWNCCRCRFCSCFCFCLFLFCFCCCCCFFFCSTVRLPSSTFSSPKKNFSIIACFEKQHNRKEKCSCLNSDTFAKTSNVARAPACKDWQRRASDRHWIQTESDSQRCFLKRQTKTKANRLNNTVTRKKTNNKKQKNNKLNNKQASIKQTRVQSVHAAPEAVDRGAASCRRNRRSTSRRRRRRWLCQSTLRKQQQDQIF